MRAFSWNKYIVTSFDVCCVLDACYYRYSKRSVIKALSTSPLGVVTASTKLQQAVNSTKKWPKTLETKQNAPDKMKAE
jgi:hypothetical protein